MPGGQEMGLAGPRGEVVSAGGRGHVNPPLGPWLPLGEEPGSLPGPAAAVSSQPPARLPPWTRGPSAAPPGPRPPPSASSCTQPRVPAASAASAGRDPGRGPTGPDRARNPDVPSAAAPRLSLCPAGQLLPGETQPGSPKASAPSRGLTTHPGACTAARGCPHQAPALRRPLDEGKS